MGEGESLTVDALRLHAGVEAKVGDADTEPGH